MVGFGNWAAPCMINSDELELQISMASWVTAMSPNNITAIIMPQFCWKKGQLFLAERMITNLLSQQLLNFDTKFGLPFRKKPDARDERPLFYDGRILMPAMTDKKEWLFKECELMKGRTEIAEMLPASELQVVESTSHDALPQTTDSDGTIKGAQKWVQLGADAVGKVLDAMVAGVTAFTDDRLVMIFWDFNLSVGHGFDAVMEKRASWNTPIFYFAHTKDVIHQEWFMQTKKAALKKMHLDGKVRGEVAPKAAELPQDQREEPPKPPNLKRLVIVDAKDKDGEVTKAIAVPKAMILQWATHAKFGTEFQAWINEFTTKYGAYDPEGEEREHNDEGNNGTPQKRRGSRHPLATPEKFPKVESAKVVPVASAPTGNDLVSVQMQQKGQEGLELKVKVNKQVSIWNETEAARTLVPGSLVAGFGKGTFKQNTDGKLNLDMAWCYNLESDLDFVFHNNKLMHVRDVVNEKKVTEPECKIAYHIMEPSEDGDVRHFNVRKNHDVFFVFDAKGNAETGTKMNAVQMNVAQLMPMEVWSTHCCDIIWATKWGVLGLTPVRPLVLMTKSVTLDSGRALLLDK